MKRTCAYLIIFASALLGAISCSKDKDEEVSVNQSSEKELITFTFLAATNEALSVDVTGTIDQTAKTVSAKVPFGTALTALNPTVTVSAKAAVSPTGTGNFSNAVTYTVTAEDESKATYTVNVTVAENSEKELTSFAFLAASNTELDADVIATIDQGAKTVSATVPFGTDLTALVPTIGFTAGAAIDPIGGTTDFSSPVTYTVTAMDASKTEYTVSVTVAANSAKQITSFSFLANANTGLSQDVMATIDGFTVSATVPFGTDLTALVPAIEITPGAQIDPISGTTDFSSPVTYTVTAEDGSKASYSVSVTQQTPTDRQVLVHLFKSNPGNTIDESWDVDNPDSDIGTWKGVTLDADGRVVELSIYEDGYPAKNLTVIPASIGNLTQLTELDLYGNNLTTIPAEIGNLTALTELDLGSNKLKTIPAEIGKLTALTELDLYNNQLETIPAEIGNLTALRVLGLGSNKLKTIPAEIGNLTALTELYLYFSQLETIPAEIGNLSRLTRLDLSGNQLETIPAEIGNLAQLTHLYLNSNQLETIPAEIGNLSQLTYLSLTWNQLETIPAEIGNLTALTELLLRVNKLETIPQAVCDLANTGTHLTKDSGVSCGE